MWESESESHAGERGLIPVGGGSSARHEALKNDGFVRRDQSWYVNSDIPSDLLVKVGDVSFHLHKYPMISRGGRMSRAIYESASAASSDPAAAVVVELDDVPGGAGSFELAARFCYGMAVDLTAGNISGLRCAAEYLEMTEDLEEGNLIFKTEAFLSYVVLSSWRDSIVVLKTCEGLSPWAENLQIVRRCSESIAWKACANPRGVRWAYTGSGSGGTGGGGRPPRTGGGAASPRWNLGGGGAGDSKESSPGRQAVPPPDWWFEDVSVLRIDHFVRVVTAIKVKGMRFDLIGASITRYASKWLPGLTKDGPHGGALDEPWAQAQASPGSGLHMIIASGHGGGGGKDDIGGSAPAREQRMVVESLISIIPPQHDSVSCGFLLRLAIMLKAAPALVTELEKRVGMQLEQAALADLLIPSYGRADTAYDVDLVQRLVEHFLVQEQTELLASSSPGRAGPEHPPPLPEYYGARTAAAAAASAPSAGLNAKARVARLLEDAAGGAERQGARRPAARQLPLRGVPRPQPVADQVPGAGRVAPGVGSLLRRRPLPRRRLLPQGAPDADGARAEAAVPCDGLPEAVDGRVHARGAERAAAAAGGGAGALLGAGEDQQRAGHQLVVLQRRLRRAADAAAAAGRHAAVVPGRVGGGEEGHQHAQVRAGEHEGQVPGAAARDGRAPQGGGARRRAVARGRAQGQRRRRRRQEPEPGALGVDQRLEEAGQTGQDDRRRRGRARRARAGSARRGAEEAAEVEKLHLVSRAGAGAGAPEGTASFVASRVGGRRRAQPSNL